MEGERERERRLKRWERGEREGRKRKKGGERGKRKETIIASYFLFPK